MEHTTTQPPTTDLTGKKILIVEDDVFLGQVLAQYMTHENIDTIQAKSAEEALESIEKRIPDIIVLDIYLPGMSGLEFLEKIRGEEKTKNTKVMVVSNAGQLEDRAKAESLGATFFIKALVSPQEILNNIKAEFAPKS